jgi:hypothetical protein
VPRRLRRALATLIGAHPSEIVLGNSASWSLHLIPSAYPWRSGDVAARGPARRSRHRLESTYPRNVAIRAIAREIAPRFKEEGLPTFLPEDREAIKEALLEIARRDPRISAAAVTGSGSVDRLDRWSDIDLAFAVRDGADLVATIRDFTQIMRDDYGAVDTVDIRRDPWVYRVFLLASSLQVDLAFVPASDFGARAPTFALRFGEAREVPQVPVPDKNELIAYAWLYGLHVRSSIARGRPWQALYMINTMRDRIMTLSCLRLGVSPHEGRGFDSLPPSLKASMVGTVPRSLARADLLGAFDAAARALSVETVQVDAALASRLEPVLRLMVETPVIDEVRSGPKE